MIKTDYISYILSWKICAKTN